MVVRVSAGSDRCSPSPRERPLAVGTSPEVREHPEVVKAYLGG